MDIRERLASWRTKNTAADQGGGSGPVRAGLGSTQDGPAADLAGHGLLPRLTGEL